MIDRCKELTDKLISHDKKIRKGSLNKNQYRAWQRDLVEAKMLNLRIDDYNAKLFEQDGSFMNNLKKEALSNYYDFSKALEISKNYAGL